MAVTLIQNYGGFRIDVQQHGVFTAHDSSLADEQGRSPSAFSDKTLEKVKEWIDKQNARNIKARVVSLPVILVGGELRTITGVHTRLGTITGIPEVRGATYNAKPLYPSTEGVKRQILKISELRQHMSEAQEELDRVNIGTVRARERDLQTPEQYSAVCDRLEAEHAEKLKLAKQLFGSGVS